MTRVLHVIQAGPISVSVVQELEMQETRTNGRRWGMVSLVPVQVHVSVGGETQTFTLSDGDQNSALTPSTGTNGSSANQAALR